MTDERGFSLLELLVSLAIVAVISLFVGQGVELGRRLAERTETIEIDAEQIAAREFLRHAASRIRRMRGNAAIALSPQRLTFLTDLPFGDPAERQVRRISVSVEDGSGHEIVWLRILDPETGAQIAPAKIIARYTKLSMAVFDGREWRVEWNHAADIPKLVKIRFSNPAFPELILAPQDSAT